MVVCSFALAIPLAVAAFIGHINATPVLDIPPYPKAPKTNGYDLYVAAANSIRTALPSAGVATDTQTVTDPKIAAQRYSLARKDAWLAKNQTGFALFDRAMTLPALPPPDRTIGRGSGARGALRELARNKLTQSDAFWMRGDANGALQSGLDIVQMGHQIRRGGLLDNLLGIAVGTMGRATNHQTVDKLNAAQALGAAHRLEKMLQTRWSLAQALTEDKYGLQSIWLQTFRSPHWRADIANGSPQPGLAEIPLIYTTPKQKIMDDVSAVLDQQIARSRLPYLQQTLPPLDLDNPFIKDYQHWEARVRFINARDLAGDQLLMLRLALRVYRVQNGVYPPNLDALTPHILRSIPADPFGAGAIWHYKPSGQSYLLWSIGPDGRDDGGKPIAWRNSLRSRIGERPRLPPAMPESKGDIVAGKNQ